MFYELDYLDEHYNWTKLIEDNDIKVIDKAIWCLIHKEEFLKMTKHFRVLENNKVLMFFNDFDRHYFYFHNRYVRKRSLDFDMVAEYHKRLKK